MRFRAELIEGFYVWTIIPTVVLNIGGGELGIGIFWLCGRIVIEKGSDK